MYAETVKKPAQPENGSQTLPEEQMSPKDILKKFGQGKELFKKYWKLILLCVILGGVLGWVYDKYNYKPTRYMGFLTFNLETGQGQNDMGGISDLASAFGLGGGAQAGAGGLFFGENFILLVKSRTMLEKALMKEVTIKGKKYILANYYIEKSGILADEWKGNEKLQKLRFTQKPRNQFSTQESVAMMAVVKKIDEETSFSKQSPKSTFTTLKCNTEDELLSKVWLETLIATISDYYTTVSTKKTQEVLKVAKRRVDSLASALSGNDSRLARFADQNQQVVAQQARVAENRLTRNTSLLASMYFEAVRSLESIRMSLVKETPLLTIIDEPVLPLMTEVYEEGKNIKAGILIGLVVSIVIIFLRKTYQDIMNS